MPTLRWFWHLSNTILLGAWPFINQIAKEQYITPAFICVMHMDVRMPQAQGALARRICVFFFFFSFNLNN